MPTITGDPNPATDPHVPWNKGQLVGQKRPLRPKDVWSIRARLEIDDRERDLALFNLAVDSKLRASDLVSLKVEDVQIGGRVRERAAIIQQKTARPVQFEFTDNTRKSPQTWLVRRGSTMVICSPTTPDKTSLISRRASMPVSSMDGWQRLASIVQATEHIRCVAPEQLRSIARPAI